MFTASSYVRVPNEGFDTWASIHRAMRGIQTRQQLRVEMVQAPPQMARRERLFRRLVERHGYARAVELMGARPVH